VPKVHLPADRTDSPAAPQLDPGAAMLALHRATLSLFTDLSLDGVLRRVVHAAQELAHARYAALGVPDGSGGLSSFITSGLSDEEMQRIPHLPVGKGLIGEMMRTGRSIRAADVTAHPMASGFPPGHPHMRSFLGVPIAAYGRPLGQIYLTDKESAPEFTEHDQRQIEMLASHAAAAIENARLYRQVLESEAELTQRNEELELINSLTSAVSSSMELNDLLGEMLERVISLFAAGAGEIFLADEGRKTYRLALHRGQAKEAFWQIDRFHLGEGFIGRVVETGRPVWTSDLASEKGFLRKAVVQAGFGAMVCVPLMARGQVVGVLSLAFRGDRSLNARELGLLEAVGAGVGIAVENARLNQQARRVAVLEERERIGMDLHDGIIQSIYAVGLTLDSTRVLVASAPQEAGKRLRQSIESLNKIIQDIRAYILDLKPTRIRSADLAENLHRLTREFKANSLVEVELQAEEEALVLIQPAQATALFHIAQEALANVLKHAQATRVWVSVRRSENQVLMQVTDNGDGFDLAETPEILGHGLTNMADRARLAGGEWDVVSGPGQGTTITVRLLVEPLLPDVNLLGEMT